jgi:hypothetical protein
LSYQTSYLFQGYQVASGANFKSQWYDLKNAQDYSISVRFYTAIGTGGVSGTIALYASNEPSIGAPVGGLQNAVINQNGLSSLGPTSTAQFGEQPQFNGLDAVQLPNTATQIQGPQPTGNNGSNVVMFRDQFPGYRWVQYVATGFVGTGSAGVPTAVASGAIGTLNDVVIKSMW